MRSRPRQSCLIHVSVADAQHSFDEQPPAPELPDPRDVVPLDGRLEERGDHRGAAECRGGRRRQVALEIAEARHAGGDECPPQPARVAQHVERGAHGGSSRGAVAAPVPLPVAEHVRVGGEHQRLIAGRSGALDDVTCDRAFLEHVELQPEPPAGTGRELLEPRGRERAERERNAEAGRRAREREVTLRVEHAVQARGGDDERSVGGAPEDRDTLMARRGVDQGLRDEPQPLEGVAGRPKIATR